MEASIHSLIAFVILPVFAFVNCELTFSELSYGDVFSNISLGCGLGLFIGKLLLIGKVVCGVRLPYGSNLLQMLGISCLCGIGFTLSLFIGLLAFDSEILENQMKVGVLCGSAASAILGTIILKYSVQVNKDT